MCISIKLLEWATHWNSVHLGTSGRQCRICQGLSQTGNEMLGYLSTTTLIEGFLA